MMQVPKLITIVRLLTRLSLVYCVFIYWQPSDAYSIYPEGKGIDERETTTSDTRERKSFQLIM